VEIHVGEFSLYLDELLQSSFIFGEGTAFPHLFFLHYTPGEGHKEYIVHGLGESWTGTPKQR